MPELIGYELAIHAKLFGSETAVRVIADLMRIVGIDSYGHELPLAGLLQDAAALPLFAGAKPFGAGAEAGRCGNGVDSGSVRGLPGSRQVTTPIAPLARVGRPGRSGRRTTALPSDLPGAL